MKFSALALFGLLGGAAAFTPSTHIGSQRQTFFPRSTIDKSTSLQAKVGVVGATGAVGKEIVGCLEKRNFPVESLRIFGSSRSAGSTVKSKFGDVTVELFDVEAAKECDVVFLAVSGDFALEHAEAISQGAIVIDNSSAFRYKPEVPLCVPEINGSTIKGKKLIANPNCTTAIGLMAVNPLLKKFGMKRLIMSTYQASSGAGQEGMDELKAGTKAVVNGEREVAENKVFAHPLPFNVIPHIDKFQENGYTKEEMKVTWETRKICGLADDFPASCTAVRIPTYRAHSESIVIETEKKVDVAVAQAALAAAPGVKLIDDILSDPPTYPMPLSATGQYDVEVGRVRRSEAFGDYGLEFFVSGDQLLRGAALNAVLVAEECVNNGDLA
ncbi:hypothetical protein TrCOL_g4918 [Triparma columacea]|uniref:aspartate-semialdehyde dehydrogenase n=1 Tax=Triparma columacea TaxID=722753 RepID=A0A9W7GC56_9STRA|nr:hypothetical protein TrCOL_g4918 [Triparma columacea]